MATQLILPTGINYLLMLHDQLLQGRRVGISASVTVPPLRRRAWMIVHETGAVVVEGG